MPLLKNGRPVADTWTRVSDDAAVPATRDVIVSLDRLLAETAALTARPGRLGVALAPDADLDTLAPHLTSLDLVAVAFPRFADGRGYSLASLLRMRYAFAGEIRAVGDVLRDQIGFMMRCGIDAVDLRNAQADEAALALSEISVVYQTAADGATPAWRARRLARTQAAQPAQDLRVAAE